MSSNRTTLALLGLRLITGCGSHSAAKASGEPDAGSGAEQDAAPPPSEASANPGSAGQDPSTEFIPTVTGTCPDMKTGNVMFSGQTWQLWAGTPTVDQHGPLLLYWHGTGSTSGEPTFTIGQAQIDAITAEGGLVASPQATTGQGNTTNNNVWYTGDFDPADQVVACAIDQLHIDTRRIYVSGASAGGLQAVYMSYARSGYLAAAAPLSGGYLFAATQQDPTNVPAAMATHGAQGKDVVIIDFAQASAKWEADVTARGGFAIDCDTGGGHVSGPPAIGPAIWQFLQDHPFKVSPEPYQGALPSVFPSYCTIQ